MASGDDKFVKTLCIEGEYDKSNKFHKFKKPIVYFRVPQLAATRPKNRHRSGSAPPSMARKLLVENDLNVSKIPLDDQVSATGIWREKVLQVLSKAWITVCFFGINALCYAIDPPAAALMMSSSIFLLHLMRVVGRGVTLFILLISCAALLGHGSDFFYVMVIHTLFCVAITLGSNAGLRRSGVKKKSGPN